MNYNLWTIGCQMNAADSRHLATRLETLGWTACDRAEEADLVILNTCVVRQQAEDKAWARLQYVRSLKERRPGMKIALMGCLVGTREGTSVPLREQLAFVDYFLPPSDFTPLLAGLGEEESDVRSTEERERRERERLQEADVRLPAAERGAVTANVPVVLGCSHACTYCIIPYRRGAEHSRPAAEILDEVRGLAAAGVREVLLLGQIVDRYGRDLPGGPDLAGLLRAVAQTPGLRRVRFMTSHPAYVTDDLLDTVAREPRLCPHLEIPVQSGNDRILAAMRRGYTRDDYRRLVDRIRARLPAAAIHTDIIVGFPGETGAEFEDTLRLLEELRLDNVHLARYSPRPQTYAARRLADDVPPEEKERRWVALDAAQRRIQDEKNAAYRGRTVEVLVESRDEKRSRWRGRTPDNRLVFFPDDRDWRGHIAPVTIEWTGPYSLLGRVAESASA